MPVIQFATGSYKHPSLPISAQRAINCYAEKEPPDAKTQVALLCVPGVVEFADLTGGPIRGMNVMGGVLYVVSGTTLYSVSSSGVGTNVGGAISGSGPVSMDNNGTQLAIVNGSFGYIYSVAGGFALISDVDFNAANTVRFFNQRFVFDEDGTGRFFISGSLAGTAFDPLEFTTAESRPDNVLAIEVNQQILYILGEKTIELYQDVGAANFPFERIPGAVIERGLASSLCVAKEDNAIFFLGDDRIFYRMSGQQIQRVSNHAIESIWQDYNTFSDVFCLAWSWAGHKFVSITFPTESHAGGDHSSASATWVYDISTGLWHERDSWDASGNSIGRWRANCYVEAYSRLLIGDVLTGKIGYFDHATFTEFGNIIQALAVAPPIHSDRKRVFHSRFEVDIESGVGIASGQGSEPQIMLDYSDDGGHTFASRQMWRTMGAGGKFKSRMRWTRLGQSRSRFYRVTISDPVRRTIIAAHADVKPGLS